MTSQPFPSLAGPSSDGASEVFQQLLRKRILFLSNVIDDKLATIICAQLLLLAAEDEDRDIALYINSPGGSAYAGMAIYDTMQYVKPDVATICIGQAASAAAVLLAAGAAGKRFALPHARVLIHQPSGELGGQAADIEIHAKEILYLKARLNEILAKHTGQKLETIEKDTDRDNFLSATQAVTYGLVDKVLTSRTEATV